MKQRKISIERLFYIALFLMGSSVFAYSPFVNYSPPNRINDILIDEKCVYAASQGGLMRIDPIDYTVSLDNTTDKFPDPDCVSLVKDLKGNILIGSRRGYLYTLTPRGSQTINTSYVSSKWTINDMYLHGKYLIVASDSGCSIFDIKDGVVVQQGSKFGSFTSSRIFAVNVYRDTLYLGCDNGVAKLDISGNKILTSSLVDENIWITQPTSKRVVSLPVFKDSIYFMTSTAAEWNDQLYYAFNIIPEQLEKKSEYYVYTDSTRKFEFNSAVSSIVEDKNGECWFATEEDFLYRFDGNDWHHYTVNGLTFKMINRVYVTREGKVWLTPVVKRYNTPWWMAVAAFDGKSWRNYLQGDPWDFGELGDGSDFFGVAEDRTGNMWFGNNGGSVKRFIPNQNRWDGFKIDFSKLLYKPRNNDMGWGKCDGIALDSSGYLWFCAFSIEPYNYQDSGCVICYDPRTALPSDDGFNPNIPTPDDTAYQFFLEKGSSYFLKNPNRLNVDAAGYIFLAGQVVSNGDPLLTVFKPDTNPLIHGIQKPIYSENITNVRHLTSLKDNTTWIVTDNGLSLFQHLGETGYKLTKFTSAPAKISCVEVERFEEDTVRDYNFNPIEVNIQEVLWLGTLGDGLVRLFLYKHRYAGGIIDSISIDSMHVITQNDGLLDNYINYMDIDRVNGYLWIATYSGLCRYDLGHSFEELNDNSSIKAYPNPFLKSRHKQVVFTDCAPNSSISLYTVDGKLVAHIGDKGGDVKKTPYAWTFIWNPGKNLLPGMYFYTAKQSSAFEKKIKKSTVGKILFLP